MLNGCTYAAQSTWTLIPSLSSSLSLPLSLSLSVSLARPMGTSASGAVPFSPNLVLFRLTIERKRSLCCPALLFFVNILLPVRLLFSRFSHFSPGYFYFCVSHGRKVFNWCSAALGVQSSWKMHRTRPEIPFELCNSHYPYLNFHKIYQRLERAKWVKWGAKLNLGKKKVTNKQNYIKKKCWGEKIRKTKLGRISKLVLYLI